VFVVLVVVELNASVMLRAFPEITAMRRNYIAGLMLALAGTVGMAQTAPAPRTAPTAAEVDAIYPDLEALYVDLHRNPELAFQETQTAARLAARMKALGFDVTTGVGRTGIVAVLKNGAGPTAMMRTELDALPVAEKTGLPFASTVVAKNAAGQAMPVMHACGHDLHMAAWAGTARLMAEHRDRWRGTLVMVGQPAEEGSQGAASSPASPGRTSRCRCTTTTRCPRGRSAITLASSARCRMP
jgi:hippurate hydrolase